MGALIFGVWLPLLVPWFLVGTSYLTPILFFVSLIYAFRWRSALPLLVLILNPCAVGFGFGLAESLKSKPHFQSMGLPGYESFNLDPDTRCYWMTGGCLVRENEWLTQTPFNAGLKLMLLIFGAPKGTYHGPYPTKEEATAITAAAAETSPDQFLNGEIIVDGKPLTIGKELSGSILNDMDLIFFDIETKGASRQVKAAVFQQHCLVIRVSMQYPDQVNSDGIFLFESDSLRPFARYIISGHAPRIPRLLRY